MTTAQIKKIRDEYCKEGSEKGKTLAKSVYYDFTDSMVFRSGFDFVVFDDANELVHCIAVNNDNNMKLVSPFKIFSAAYEQLQYIEGNFDMDGLISVIDSMFKTLLNAQQIEVVKEWAKSIPSTAIKPNRATPYFETDPLLNPSYPEQIVRDDGKTYVEKTIYPSETDHTTT